RLSALQVCGVLGGFAMPTFLRNTAVVFLLAGAWSAYSQATTSLRGTISDSQGLALPTAVLTLTNVENSAARKVISNAVGEYVFVQIPPGTYKIIAERPGFTTATRDHIQLLVNTPATLDLRLEVGTTTETVNVQSETSTVNTVDASIGNAFSEQQVRQLPLQTRNVVELLSLQPGVTTNGEVLGARRDQNNITLDGVDVNDNQNAGLVTQNSSTGVTYQGVNGNNNKV